MRRLRTERLRFPSTVQMKKQFGPLSVSAGQVEAGNCLFPRRYLIEEINHFKGFRDMDFHPIRSKVYEDIIRDLHSPIVTCPNNDYFWSGMHYTLQVIYVEEVTLFSQPRGVHSFGENDHIEGVALTIYGDSSEGIVFNLHGNPGVL